MKVRYAIHRTSDDRYPIMFQPHCERTVCDSIGNSEALFDLLISLDKAGWDLVDELPSDKLGLEPKE